MLIFPIHPTTNHLRTEPRGPRPRTDLNPQPYLGIAKKRCNGQAVGMVKRPGDRTERSMLNCAAGVRSRVWWELSKGEV